MPGRNTKPFVQCAKGVCTYNFDGGIVHNTLYLKKSPTALAVGVLTSRQYICLTAIRHAGAVKLLAITMRASSVALLPAANPHLFSNIPGQLALAHAAKLR